MKFSKFIKYGLCVSLLLIEIGLVSCTHDKHIYINTRTQTLTAYDGKRLILSSPISSGKFDSPTPPGFFKVLEKEKMHYSTLYNNAPMPYSIQFYNNYFIHAGDLPGYPASHGCVRVPTHIAKKLFNWTTLGTPVTIGNKDGLKKEN